MAKNKYVFDISKTDYFAALGEGRVDGRKPIYKFGRVLTQIGKRVPIWDGNSNYVFPAVADTVLVTSSDINDNPTGTGARKIRIIGLDVNWDEIYEDVPVGSSSTIEYIRVFRAYVVENGTSDFPYDDTKIGNNIGTITITHANTLSPIAIILPRIGQTLMAIYTVPRGYELSMWSAKTNIGKGNDAIGYMYVRDNTNGSPAWLCKGVRDMFQNTVGNEFQIPVNYGEKTDLVFAVEGAQNGIGVSGTMQLELIKSGS